MNSYTLLTKRSNQFVLSAEEKSDAPQHFGMLSERSFGSILLETKAGKVSLAGFVVTCLRHPLKKVEEPSAAEVSSAASSEMPLEASLEAPLEASAAKDLGKRYEAHWLCEAVTPQIKSLLQDIVANRVTKEQIPAAWAAL